MPPKKENQLLQPISNYFRRKGYRRQGSELQFYEFSIDLYGVSERQKRTIAVELKLEKWKRAFQQALIYQLCSDLVYIAVPSGIVKRVDRDLLEQYGVGLISVNGKSRCTQVVAARKSSVVRSDYKRIYVEHLKTGA